VKSALLCLAAIVLAGCAKNIDTPEAVKEGVLKDIAKKVDVQSMDVNVDNVSFQEKEANAQVSFKPKGMPKSQSIVMNYQLVREGNEWKIKSRSMQGHEQAAAQQETGEGQPGLPPGHPSVAPGTQASPLPAGHPHVNGQNPDSPAKP
jgi:hypothetical protein